MPVAVESPERQLTLELLDDLFGRVRPRDFAVRLWDGSRWGPDEQTQPRFTLALAHPGALRAMFFPPGELSLGEAYVYGDYDVEGDLEAAMRLGEATEPLRADRAALARIGLKLLRLPSQRGAHEGRGRADVHGMRHSRTRDRQAISYHYDVGNDFYSLWHDDAMVYSCAYFEHESQHLGDAQRRKLDYICRKLRLAPGERLLDVGCGWGGLVLHAAREYGVEAVGVTLSRAQVELARGRISAEGLEHRCRAEYADYRDVDEARPFDKLVSVGMFEHVGEQQLPEYFAKAFRLLRPGGAFLNHGIASATANSSGRGGFSDKHVFPDGELVPVSRTLSVAEAAGFEVRDVESLREHYAITLRRWVANLERHHDEAAAATDEATYRTWRLFMSASARGFATGSLQVYQSLLVRPADDGSSGVPLTREDWYGTPSG
jgi:cyclopropane-fatty-acyl-phospholipid synthase